jgi:hypothetical protein
VGTRGGLDVSEKIIPPPSFEPWDFWLVTYPGFPMVIDGSAILKWITKEQNIMF